MANKIEFKIFGDSTEFNKSLKSLNTQIKSVSNGARNAFIGLSAAITGATLAAKNYERVLNQTEAVIKSTGGVAKITKKQVEDLGNELQNLTAFSNDTIIEAQNLLLTFKEISGTTFPRATKAILDVSQAMNQGIKESAIQVGKALNDPVLGLTALRRVGIQFTDDQEKLIKKFVELGEVSKAQNIILTELESQFGGSAEAARKGLGALDALKNSTIDLAKEIGFSLAPTISNLANSLSDIADSLRKNKAFIETTGQVLLLGTAFAGILFILGTLSSSILSITALLTAHGTVVLTVVSAISLFIAAWYRVNDLKVVFASFASGINEALSDIALKMADFYDKLANLSPIAKNSLRNTRDSFIGLAVTFNESKTYWDDYSNNAILRSQEVSEAFNLQAESIKAKLEEQKNSFSDFFTEVTSIFNGEEFAVGFNKGLEKIKENVTDMTVVANNFVNQLQTNLSKAFSDILTGTKSGKEAFKELGKAMLKTIIDYAAQWLAFQVISKTALATSTALGIASGTSLTAAYAPAALAASIATFGGAAAAGIAANNAAAVSWASNLQLVKAAGSFAVGTPNVPNDMIAQVHQGETIIPKTFAESIRQGDLTLSGGEEGGGGGGISLNFNGATFMGVTEDIVEQIFTKASEMTRNRTLISGVA